MYSIRASSLPQGQQAGYSLWFDKQRFCTTDSDGVYLISKNGH